MIFTVLAVFFIGLSPGHNLRSHSSCTSPDHPTSISIHILKKCLHCCGPRIQLPHNSHLISPRARFAQSDAQFLLLSAGLL